MTFKEIWKNSKSDIVAPKQEIKEGPLPIGDGSESTPPEGSKLRILKALSLLGVDSFQELAESERKMLEYIASELHGDLGDEIVRTENRIGTPPVGMSRIRHIYNSLRFKNGIKNSSSEQQQSDIIGDSREDASRNVKIEIRL